MKRRYSFAAVTTPDGRGTELSLPTAKKLCRGGVLRYDGKVIQAEAVEHCYSLRRGHTLKSLPDKH